MTWCRYKQAVTGVIPDGVPRAQGSTYVACIQGVRMAEAAAQTVSNAAKVSCRIPCAVESPNATT